MRTPDLGPDPDRWLYLLAIATVPLCVAIVLIGACVHAHGH